MAAAERTRWAEAVMVQSVRGLERTAGRLPDEDALQAAARATPDFERRVALRAWLLGQRLGLAEELARWRALLPWLIGGAAVLVGLVSVPLLKSIVGEGRHISLLGALAALLALPTLSLLLWCTSLLLGPGHAGGGLARAVGSLATRLPGLRSRHSARLWAAGIEALRDAGLGLWALGALNHLFWILAFAGVLAGLLASFAFWSYSIGWETTILSPEFFTRLVHAIGWLPAKLGVPGIDPGLANQPGPAAAGGEAARAWWLVGCTVVYGLLPRLLAIGSCALMAWRRWPRVGRLNPQDPDLAELAARFAAIDAQAGGAPAPVLARARTRLAVVGFELPADQDWPPLPALPEDAWTQRIAGEAAERRALAERVGATRPAAVLVVCRAAASPDRGTARLLQALTGPAGRAAIWLQGDDEHPAWRPWLQGSPLARLAVLRDAAGAAAWVTEVSRG